MMKHLLLLSGIMAVYCFLTRGTVWLGPYTYDEADYMYATSLGWTANWTDTPTMPVLQFVNIGLHRGGDRNRADLSDLIRNSGDLVFYRHWHGPLYGDWLALVSCFRPTEPATRALGRMFPVGAALLLYFGALWTLTGAARPIAAIFGCVLYLWSFPVVRTTELAPHHLYALCVIATLLPLMKMFQPAANVRRCWYLAVVMAALSLCVLEIAFTLILTLLVCAYAARRSLKPDTTLAARSIGAFGATVLLVWPGAVLKFSFIKAYLFMAFLAIFRRGAWGDVSAATTWMLRLANSPVPWLLLVVAVAFVWKQWRKAPFLIPPAVYSALTFIALLPVKTDVPRYTLPLLPGVVLCTASAAALILAGWRPAARAAGVLLIVVAMFITSWPKVRAKMPAPNERAEAMLAVVRNHAPSYAQVAVPHEELPMLHYYFPQLRFTGYYDEGEIRDKLRGGVGAVIYRGEPPHYLPRFEPAWENR